MVSGIGKFGDEYRGRLNNEYVFEVDNDVWDYEYSVIDWVSLDISGYVDDDDFSKDNGFLVEFIGKGFNER